METKMRINLWAAENTASIIIEDEKSPIIYSNQAGGLACSHPETKGYLIPVEFRGRILVKFMNSRYAMGWDIDDSFYDDIPEIMKQLSDYFYDDYSFELDQSKADKNIESWVYLIAKRITAKQKHHGLIQGFPETFTAILTWPNSD
jgi:hypothetical protein